MVKKRMVIVLGLEKKIKHSAAGAIVQIAVTVCPV